MTNPTPSRADSLRRLRTLRSLGAPRWIVKHEQVHLLDFRGEYRHDLFEKYVRPIMGQGSITVPDFEANEDSTDC